MPADYTTDDIRGRTDGQLYYAITSGIGLMPRFGPLLNEEDRWLLVHHNTRVAEVAPTSTD